MAACRRTSELGQFVKRALRARRFWITPIVRMKILYSAGTSAEYLAFASEFSGLETLRNDRSVIDAQSVRSANWPNAATTTAECHL